MTDPANDTFASTAGQEAPLVKLDLRYVQPDAEEVSLIWGIGGWTQAQEALRPPRTIVQNKVLRTSMSFDGEAFHSTVTIPAGTTVDYCFLLTKKRGDFPITWPLCEGDYHSTPLDSTVITVHSKITLHPITQQVSYRSQEADEVYLVWGLKGWNIAPETLRPKDTTVQDKVMRTRMERKGERFVLSVLIPENTPIDYGFLITRMRGSDQAVYMWDGDYQSPASQTRPIDVNGKALSVLEQSHGRSANTTSITQSFRYHMPEAGEVFLVWGVNGWGRVPEEMRPEGTILWKNTIMTTPMRRDGDIFTASVNVPAEAFLDYGFQIRKARDETAIWLWDGDYRTKPSKDGVLEAKATLFGVRLMSLGKMRDFGTALFLGLCALWLGQFLLWRSARFSPKLRNGTILFTVNVTFFVVFIWGGEVYLRIMGTENYLRTFPGQYENDPNTADWGQADAVLGWTSNRAYGGINGQGFRDGKDYGSPIFTSGTKRVLVLGDSFMWGVGVNADENVPSLLEGRHKNEYEFFNVSVPGWGIDQMYLGYLQYKDILQPHVVVLCFVDDDIPRVLEAYRRWEGKNKPSFLLHDGKLVARAPQSDLDRYVDLAMQKSVLFSQLMRVVYLIRDARPIVRHIIGTIAEETRKRQQRFVVVRIPTKLDSSYYNRLSRLMTNIIQVSTDAGALYLDPTDEFAQVSGWMSILYLDDIGGHLSPAGNKYLASYITKHVFIDPSAAR